MILKKITEIYHEHGGVAGYRQMQIFLLEHKIFLSKTTVHKYMNTELKLFSITRIKKPKYTNGEEHKTFLNIINQDFSSTARNLKWCIDFTYLYLSNGNKRYNCTIIDLYDRSVVASLTGKEITSDLAMQTIKKALTDNTDVKKVILHSDQGSQFTSKTFVDFCESNGIQQSMSKVGCPYDNSPMERYFNTLKTELIYLHHYRTDEELSKAVQNFAYIWYNRHRPHTYNNYKTPIKARFQ
jgi:transposase InsO family protein